MRATRRALAFAAVVAAAATASAGDVVILRGKRVVPVSSPPIADGVVVIEGGKIRAVGGPGTTWDAAGARVVTIEADVVMPGLVDGFTQLGLVEIDMVQATNDTDEAVAPLTPALHTADALHVGSSLFRVTRMNGTTSALVAPADGNLVPGRSCVIALDGDRVETMLRRPAAALHASLGEPPMLRFGKKDQAPSTRMGEVAMLRAAIVKAREYAAKRRRYEEQISKPAKPPEPGRDPPDPPEPPATDLDQEAWGPVLRGEAPLVVRAQRVSDILAALRLAQEFGLRVVVRGGAEAWKVAAELAAAEVPVLLGPVTTQPDSPETLGARYENAALLHAAGVRIAIVSADAHNARNLPYEAGIAVAYGLPHDAAIEAITLAPARILGVGDEVGSLEPGKDADVIALDGDVIQPRTKVTHMWIRGREVELTSRQTELGDRYR